MIRYLTVLKCFYRRGKARREHIDLDDNLKDLTKAQTFQKQVDEHRQLFETNMPKQTLTETLKQQKPKLDRKFQVDKKGLQKQIRKIIGAELKVQRIQPAAQDQQFQTLESKSHIYDERAQIQFEQKFRGQLFVKKQTKRLIEKQRNDYRNYLQEPKNQQFVEYGQNMSRLKNSRIDSMMNFKRNNQQLRLLIDSGYIDHPENLGVLIGQMDDLLRLEDRQNVGQLTHNNLSADTQQIHSQHNTELSASTADTKHLTPQTKELHSKMMQNIPGPEQLRNPHKLQQFFQTLKQTNHHEKQTAKHDLQLMKQIKQFESNTFLNRYNTLNFRFKGQVDFSWMKQSELLSYIKTERNENTQPAGLLTMYAQQKSLQNKFNQPIVTPTVMSRIYSVCSLYNFPQTDQNNRINMLNDKKYVDLERNLFKNVHQLSDSSFADAVFAYCRNHKEEQGVLRPKLNAKIVEVMWKELNERVDSMSEEDLGLILRSVIHTSMLKSESLDWRPLVSALSERLPSMQKDYQFESVMSLLALVPSSQESIQTIRQNMPKFKSYKWQSRQTLQSFMQCTSFLIRYKGQLSPARQQKTIQQLKHLFASKHEQIMPIVGQLSINVHLLLTQKMPQLLSVIYYFEKSKQLQARFEIEIPNKLINKCKKEIVDNVRLQKELINKYTVCNVAMSMAMIDYCKGLQNTDYGRSQQLSVLQQSTTLSLFPFRPIPFNSITYFTYHELTKLINSQIAHVPVRAIAQTLFAASLVRYKNEGIYEDIMSRTVEKIYHQIKELGQPQAAMHLKYTKDYAMMVCVFHHCRMVNQYYYHFVGYLQENGVAAMVKLQPNLLLRFFETVASLSFTTDAKYHEDYAITKHFCKVFDLCFQENFKNCLQAFTKEQLLLLEYLTSLFQFFNAKQALSLTDKNKKHNPEPFLKRSHSIHSHLTKYQPHFSVEEQYLQSITKLLNTMTQHLQLPNQNQIQLHSLIDPHFVSAQTKFYKFSINTIMDQEQHIGSQFKYDTVYENVRKKLLQQHPQIKFDPQTWRIENPQNKEVYFLTTYEHLFAKYQNDSTTVRLFGFWKVYFELYAMKQWKFKFICTFLEG